MCIYTYIYVCVYVCTISRYTYHAMTEPHISTQRRTDNAVFGQGFDGSKVLWAARVPPGGQTSAKRSPVAFPGVGNCPILGIAIIDHIPKMGVLYGL